MTDRPPRHAVPRWLLLLVAMAFLLPPSNWAAEDGWPSGDTFSTTLDAWLTYPTAVSVVHDGNAELSEFGDDVDHYTLKETDDGRLEFRQSWLTAVPLVPFVLAVDAAGAIGLGDGADALVDGRRWGPLQAVAAVLLTLASTVLVWRICCRSGLDRGSAIRVVLAWSVGSMLWSVAAKGLWQHTVLLVPLLLLMERLIEVERGSVSARLCAEMGALGAVAVLIRPAVAPMIAILMVYLVAVARTSAIWAALAGAGTVIGGVAATGALYSWSVPAYLDQNTRVGWHEESWAAVASLVASPNRNALLFAPLLALAAWGFVVSARRPSSLAVAASAAVTAQLFFTTALWDGWYGGFSYGPRFVVDVLPVALVPAITGVLAVRDEERRRFVLTAIVALGVMVNLPGGVTHEAGCWSAQYATEEDLDAAYDWSNIQFSRGYRVMLTGGRDALLGPCDR